MEQESQYLAIRAWAEDDRPREKLLQKGRGALSDAELVAILIGSGSRRESAVDLAKRILQSVQYNLQELGKLSAKDLMRFKGIGEAKAIAIITALELGHRRRLGEALVKPLLNSSQRVFELMHPLLSDLAHEEFYVLYCNHRNQLLSYECISRGGMTSTVVDLRIILRSALMHKATALILAHNHPSGNRKASHQDIQLTRKIYSAAHSIDISVLDHVIVAQDQYLSFRDEGIAFD